MSHILWIKNGRVIDPANQRDAIGDIFAVDGKIVDSISDKQKTDASLVDATGLVVAPGLVDIHVHFRDRVRRTKKTSVVAPKRRRQAGSPLSCACLTRAPSVITQAPFNVSWIRWSVKPSSMCIPRAA